jgi:hypothetical protein
MMSTLVEEFDRLSACGCGVDRKAFLHKVLFQRIRHHRFVIDN